MNMNMSVKVNGTWRVVIGAADGFYRVMGAGSGHWQRGESAAEWVTVGQIEDVSEWAMEYAG